MDFFVFYTRISSLKQLGNLFKCSGLKGIQRFLALFTIWWHNISIRLIEFDYELLKTPEEDEKIYD